jgi:hypothetical protein
VLREHDPEKWKPVSRLPEALGTTGRHWFDASAGKGRAGKIMLKQESSAGNG